MKAFPVSGNTMTVLEKKPMLSSPLPAHISPPSLVAFPQAANPLHVGCGITKDFSDQGSNSS